MDYKSNLRYSNEILDEKSELSDLISKRILEISNVLKVQIYDYVKLLNISLNEINNTCIIVFNSLLILELLLKRCIILNQNENQKIIKEILNIDFDENGGNKNGLSNLSHRIVDTLKKLMLSKHELNDKDKDMISKMSKELTRIEYIYILNYASLKYNLDKKDKCIITDLRLTEEIKVFVNGVINIGKSI